MDQVVSAKLNILLAEDDKGHTALLKRNLWRSCIDAHIIHFPDGKELLNYLNGTSNEPETFGSGKYVILLDIKMPRINGIEVLQTLKKNSELSKIPVTMLTTTNNPQEIEHCYDLGCAFYIVKPADYTKFMQTIEYLGAFLSLSNLVIPMIESSFSKTD